MTYIGIDPGSKGFVSVLRENGERKFYAIADGDMLDLAHFIAEEVKFSAPYVHAIMEEVHAVFGSSAKATFSFGEINGYIKGMLVALGVPYTLIQPKLWQKEIWNNQDMVYTYKPGKDGQTRKVVDTKNTSYNAARRLFPEIDLRKTERCKNFDDNKIDSILITECARRKNL